MRERVTHLTLHVDSLSVTNVWALPLWAWREYVTWQDQHIETYTKLQKQGVHCVSC